MSLVVVASVFHTRLGSVASSGNDPSPTGTPYVYEHQPWGDVECNFLVSGSDVVLILRHMIGEDPERPAVTPTPGYGVCPRIGEEVKFGPTMGDVNCDDAIDVVDAMFDLKYMIGIPMHPEPPPPYCPPVGAEIGYW